MLGFLGLTTDVTGFEFDKGVLLASLIFAVIAQLCVDADTTEDGEAKNLIKQKSKTKEGNS